MSTTSRLVSFILALVSLGTLGGCADPAMYGAPGNNPYMPKLENPGDPSHAAEATASCDKATCEEYCWAAGCLFDAHGGSDPTKCKAVCTSRCGDGYFDDRDAAVIACVKVTGIDLACDGPKTCCEQQLTNQICAE